MPEHVLWRSGVAVAWLSNGTATRMHAVPLRWWTDALTALCGAEVEPGVTIRGDLPPKCKKCLKRVEPNE